MLWEKEKSGNSIFQRDHARLHPMNRYLNWVTDKFEKSRGLSAIKSKVPKKKTHKAKGFRRSLMGLKSRRVTRLVAGYLNRKQESNCERLRSLDFYL